MSKQIWLPKAETKVTVQDGVQDGVVQVWEEMVMRPVTVNRPKLGFEKT